jgi:hypothetical protein
MIHFIFIDQTIGFFNSKVIHADIINSAVNLQVKFLKELNQFKTTPELSFIWASNHALKNAQDDSFKFYKQLIETETRLGPIKEVQTISDIQPLIKSSDQVFVLGGNVAGCIVNKELPFNYYSLTALGVTPTIILDLCYDYSLPYYSDRELYSTLAYFCNSKNLKFIDSFNLKKQLISK